MIVSVQGGQSMGVMGVDLAKIGSVVMLLHTDARDFILAY